MKCLIHNGKKIEINKKGVVLAYVIIIGAALIILAAMAAAAANATIGISDSGKKTREAYLSAKSGIEFAKTKIDSTTSAAMTNLTNEVDLNAEDPDHDVTVSDELYYGYGSLDAGFTMPMNSSITPSNPLYADAPIQIVYEVAHQLVTTESTVTPGAFNYEDHLTITVTSTGNSEHSTAISGLLNSGITQTYQYEAAVSVDGDVPFDPNVIPETDGIPVLDTWPTEPSTPNSGGSTLRPKSTFIYDGGYYINLYNAWITIGSDPSDYPDIVLIRPGTALDISDWHGVGPYESRKLDEFNSYYGVDIQRGDKVVCNGIYYIFRDEPETVNWVPTPPGWLWVKIPGQ